MGSLNLTAHQSVYADANVFIYTVEKIPPYEKLLQPLWSAARAGKLQVVTSELTLCEVLVKPLQSGNMAISGLFRAVLGSPDVVLTPATVTTWDSAAAVRASHSLKTPDALHAATALLSGCSLFLTNDPVFKRVAGLTVELLDDVLAR